MKFKLDGSLECDKKSTNPQILTEPVTLTFTIESVEEFATLYLRLMRSPATVRQGFEQMCKRRERDPKGITNFERYVSGRVYTQAMYEGPVMRELKNKMLKTLWAEYKERFGDKYAD
jgi:hypothetical protein